MANYVKYFTNPTFKRTEFVDVLMYQLNVTAGAVDDGIVLDRDAFNAVPDAILPKWAKINKEDINSGLHTRPATEREIYRLTHKATSRYQIHLIIGGVWIATEGQDLEFMKACADAVQHAKSVAIVDLTTGEVVYEVGL